MVVSTKRVRFRSLTTWNRERRDLKPESPLGIGVGLPFSLLDAVSSAGWFFLEEKKPMVA
jgi:hypothetical protein